MYVMESESVKPVEVTNELERDRMLQDRSDDGLPSQVVEHDVKRMKIEGLPDDSGFIDESDIPDDENFVNDMGPRPDEDVTLLDDDVNNENSEVEANGDDEESSDSYKSDTDTDEEQDSDDDMPVLVMREIPLYRDSDDDSDDELELAPLLGQGLFFHLLLDRAEPFTSAVALADGLKQQYRYPEDKCQLDFALRNVDRKAFLPRELEDMAYADSPLRHGDFHHSAPNIYVNVLLQLDIKAGDSFLNIGSGTGYLNSLVAVLQAGTKSVNHGIEIKLNLVQWARERTKKCLDAIGLVNTSDSSLPIVSFPTYFLGNGFAIGRRNRKYAKIYVAQECCSVEEIDSLLHLLESPGIMVAPVSSVMVCYNKNVDGVVSTSSFASVVFGGMIPPEEDQQEIVLDLAEIESLKSICRRKVRQLVPAHLRGKLPLPGSLVSYLNYWQNTKNI